ncbi:Exonuclease 1 [Eufriesea mexicana]|uniref:Exonuclease 1 n=1 Tax=Eufriesea mexicana TaxID=516756 RepID=A0A310SJI8_9HYME|nr:Exonuclease 1 [Eufriesea mexicana]
MGIAGLLPFLEKASKKTNIDQFSGGVVAIDSYCWLHKGVFSCAEKLSMGQPTDAYVNYCMKFIYMLLSHKIKPILVFDGRHLPAKAQTETKRRENRQTNRRKAIELIQMGQHAEARNLLRRSIDVTHEMALELIKQCHKMNIDCIVAPYEADAQLAYLNISGIADVVITEDSDLTLFGCKKVLFKMDINGNGLLVSQDKLHLAMEVKFEHFSMDDFRYMCILSGCDYLPSLPGIGLNKARKFIMRNTDCDIHTALTRLGSYLNMKSLVVTKEYRDSFILAVITFKHQLVFCPLKRKQVRLNPPMSDVTEEQLYYAGVEIDSDTALQLALGNCDPFTLKVLHNFDPDKIRIENSKRNTWSQKKELSRHIKCEQLNQKEILDAYESRNVKDTENNSDVNTFIPNNNEVSPILIRRTNPFSKQLPNIKTSPSLLFRSKSRIKGRNIMRKRTIIDEKIVTESKFFPKTITEENHIMDDTYTNLNNILLEKENMKADANNEITNINLQTLTVSNEGKMNLCPMDIDEEHNTSFVTNECKDVECSNILFNCDLEKSHLDSSINESQTVHNINEVQNLNTSLTSVADINSDFLIQQGDIDTLNNSLFNWSDTKISIKTSNKVKQNKSNNSLNSHTDRDKERDLPLTEVSVDDILDAQRREQELRQDQRRLINKTLKERGISPYVPDVGHDDMF